MPKIVIGSKTRNSSILFDTSSLVQNPYLRKNYIESIIEKDMDMEKQFKNK